MTTDRELGIDLFNKTWTLMESPERDEDELLHCAHASAYHWRQAGTVANRARSEWQCSRVYSVLGRAEPALHHARRCLELVRVGAGRDRGVRPALRVRGDGARERGRRATRTQAREWLARARAAGEEIGDEDDRASSRPISPRSAGRSPGAVRERG